MGALVSLQGLAAWCWLLLHRASKSCLFLSQLGPQPARGHLLFFWMGLEQLCSILTHCANQREAHWRFALFRDRAAECNASFHSAKIARECIATITGAGAQALWICSLQSLGGAEDCALSSPNTPIPSHETAQALKDTVRSHAGLPSWNRVGREDKMSPSSQAPSGRKANPLMGFQRDLQIVVGSRAGSAHGKASQAGGESAKDRMCFWGGDFAEISCGVRNVIRSSIAAALQALVVPSFSHVPWGFCCHQSTSKSLGSVVISNTVLLDNSQQTLF